MRIYLAGPLFTQAERLWNRELKQYLLHHGHEVFLPQEHPHTSARETFLLNLAYLRECEAVVAILDGADADSGTCWECGYAFARGKPVVAVRSDLRCSGDDEGFNLMLSQSAHPLVSAEVCLGSDEHDSVAALSGHILEALSRLAP